MRNFEHAGISSFFLLISLCMDCSHPTKVDEERARQEMNQRINT